MSWYKFEVYFALTIYYLLAATTLSLVGWIVQDTIKLFIYGG